MAAPPEITIQNLSGKYTLNKSFSDDQDPFLSLQGIGWLTRKAIKVSNITLDIKEYEADAGVIHIDVTSRAGNLSTTQEDRVLNWVERSHKDSVFGEVKGQSRFFKTAEFEMAIDGTEEDKKWLLAEIYKDSKPSAYLDDEHVQSVAVSQDGGNWSVDQTWGFETVNGERRYTRRCVCKKKGKTERLRLVYDYNGPLDG